ncbi:unnamed protein product [Laminaria digitata]
MTTPAEVTKGVESLKNFERALGHVRNSVRPLALMSREEVGSCVSAADRAKLNLQVAYGVSSLFYMFLRTQGVSPSNHPVKGELERIRGYFGRLKQVGKPPEQRTLKVDTEASRRFINSALASDSVWKNAKSSDPTAAQQKRASVGIGRSVPAGQPADPPSSDRRTQESLSAAPGSGKRKHAASSVQTPQSWQSAQNRQSGAERSTVGEGRGRVAPGQGEAVAAAGGPSPSAKKAKGGGKGGSGKKPARYHQW